MPRGMLLTSSKFQSLYVLFAPNAWPSAIANTSAVTRTGRTL